MLTISDLELLVHCPFCHARGLGRCEYPSSHAADHYLLWKDVQELDNLSLPKDLILVPFSAPKLVNEENKRIWDWKVMIAKFRR